MRERYFVGKDVYGETMTASVNVSIGSPADKARPSAFAGRFGLTDCREVGRAEYLKELKALAPKRNPDTGYCAKCQLHGICKGIDRGWCPNYVET